MLNPQSSVFDLFLRMLFTSPRGLGGRWAPPITRHSYHSPITCHKNPNLFDASSSEAAAPAPLKNTELPSEVLAPSRRAALSAAASVAAAAAMGTGAPLPVQAAFDSPRQPTYSPPADAVVREAKMVMRVTALRGTVPSQWVQDFSTALEGYGAVAMQQKPRLADIWAELKGEAAGGKKGKRKFGKKAGQPTTVDCVTLGDSWLQPAIDQGLIQPLDEPQKHRYWREMSPRWRQLVLRSPTGGLDPAGQAWGVPYRWGCTMILYRTDTAARWGGSAGRRISDWDDLLLPGLKDRVAFVDSPRELVGVALKTLGLRYCATVADLEKCGLGESAVAARVRQLAGQVKVFSNVDHVRAWSAGEVDVLVGWSDDLVPLAARTGTAELVVPSSGTALFADLWCVPSDAAGGAQDGEPSPLVPVWMDLGLQPVRARQSLRLGASPLALPEADKPAAACNPLRGAGANGGGGKLDASMIPSDAVLRRSEFLLPLDSKTKKLYRSVLLQAA